jgi:hypothetical protein
MGRNRCTRARRGTRRRRARRRVRRRLRAAAAGRQAAARVRNLRGALRLLARASEGRHEAHVGDRPPLGRPLATRGQHPSRDVHRGAGISGQGPRRRPDAGLRGRLSGALAGANRARASELRSLGPLRAAGISAHPARALHARVHQPAGNRLSDKRLRPVDPAHLHRQRAQQRLLIRGTATPSASGTATSSCRTRNTCCRPTSRAGRR